MFWTVMTIISQRINTSSGPKIGFFSFMLSNILIFISLILIWDEILPANKILTHFMRFIRKPLHKLDEWTRNKFQLLRCIYWSIYHLVYNCLFSFFLSMMVTPTLNTHSCNLIFHVCIFILYLITTFHFRLMFVLCEFDFRKRILM